MTTFESLSPLTLAALGKPPVEWDAYVATLMGQELSDLANELLALAQASTRIARYFDRRSLGQDHDDAVNKSNLAVAALRKALGYNMPQAGNIDF